MKKYILIFFAGLSGIIVLSAIYIFTDPDLPANSESVITQITNTKIPELIEGKTGYVLSDSVRIWYEVKQQSENAKGTILLVNGYTEPCTFWNQYFLKTLVDSGYQVIRFDNRCVGLSDWQGKWSEDDPISIDDLISDAIAVLDKNEIANAHVMGYSMGGFIGMGMAIKHPERILSLTSLSSSADLNHPEHPDFDWTPMPVIRLALRFAITADDESFLKFMFKFTEHLNGGSSYPMDLRFLGEKGLYELHKRRGYNQNASMQQMPAIKNAKSYDDELYQIRIPTLVVHGKNDPILNIGLAMEYAEKMSRSRKIWIENAGHLISTDYVKKFLPDFFEMVRENK